jgi:hypothetical protein
MTNPNDTPNFMSAPDDADHDFSLGQGQNFPFVQWVEPMPAAAQGSFMFSGGFFIPATQFPAGFTPQRTLDKAVFDDGETTDGLGFYPVTYVTPLAFRTDWFVGQGRDMTFFRSYQAGLDAGVKPRGRTRIVVLLRNDDLWSYGPVMLSIKGTKGLALQKALDIYDTGLRQALQLKYKRHWAKYAFWAPIKVGPKTEVGKEFRKNTWPPVLAMPEKYDIDAVGAKAFVGSGVMDLAERVWQVCQDWAQAPIGGQYGEPQLEPADEEGAGQQLQSRNFRQPESAGQRPPWAGGDDRDDLPF